ncbi:MAG TPA: response regulator transcription factor [Bacteroidales bacterium]|nr:response regulator transcription factor [Bacteroidales bacterium]HRZ75787.1 response regulator transcription factor [Bacteroidales bacterium]
MNEIIRIIIADDHQLVIDGIKSLLLHDEGLSIVGEANDGIELMNRLQVVSADILLLDINMPRMNGLEVMAAIRKKHPSTRVIILSMHNERAIVQRLIDLGASGYVLKNADRKELVEAIRQVAAGLRYFSGEVTLGLIQAREAAGASPGGPDTLPELTSRETEILRLVAEGLSNKEISDRLFISHRTVDTHRTNIMRKIGVSNVAGLIRFAIRHGFLS